MSIILQTERLKLRELKVSDEEHFYQLNDDPEVLRFTGDKPFIDLKEAEDFLQNYNQYAEFGFGRWAVLLNQTHEFIGWCGIKYSKTLDEYDVGFRLNRQHWNQGFASEAARACINYGISVLKIPTIYGRAMRKNKASVRVLQKIGMKYVKEFDFDGEKGVVYSIKKKADINNIQS